MIIDKTHRRWCLLTVVLLALLTVAYVVYVRQSINGPSGGSRPGLWFGVLAAGLMLYAFTLAIRRRFPSNAGLGSGQFWLRGHLWLGGLTLPVALFHSGFRFGGPLEQWLMGLFLVVILTGLYGVVVQQIIPRLMRLEVPQETFLAQARYIVSRQRLLCDREIAKACGPLKIEGDAVVGGLQQLLTRMSAATTREEREAWLDHVDAGHKTLLSSLARVAKDNNWQVRKDGKLGGLRQHSDLPFAFPLIYDWPESAAPAPAASPAPAATTPPASAPKPAAAAAAKPTPTPAPPGPAPAAAAATPAAGPPPPPPPGTRPGPKPAPTKAGSVAPIAASANPAGTAQPAAAAVAVAEEEECADASQSTTFDVMEMLKELKEAAEIRLSGEFPALSFEDEFDTDPAAPPVMVDAVRAVSVPPLPTPAKPEPAQAGSAKPAGAKPSPAEMLAAARAKKAAAEGGTPPAAAVESTAPPAPAKPAGAKPSPAEMLAAARAKKAAAEGGAPPAAAVESSTPPAPAKPAGAKPSPAEMLAAARAKKAAAEGGTPPAAAAEGTAPPAPAKPAGAKPSPAEMLAAARAKKAAAEGGTPPAAAAEGTTPPAAAKPAGAKPSPAEMLAAAKAKAAGATPGAAAGGAAGAKPSPAELLAKVGQKAAPGAGAPAAPVVKRPTVLAPVAAPIPEHRLAALKDFYLNQVRPFLGGPGTAGLELGNADASHALFSRQRAEFPAALHPQLQELEAACDEQRQLRRARQLHRWLHSWLAIHIPASMAVIVLLILHIVLALRVNPFSF